MLGQQTCLGCGRISPETHGEITLTTSFGWRLRRNPQATPDAAIEWRCPACWAHFKAAQASPPAEVPIAVPPSSSGGKAPKR